jgi:2-dehydropantoate 2-reductase
MNVPAILDHAADALPLVARIRARQRGLKIVLVGTGVIGGTVAGWVAPHHDRLYVLDQGATAQALRRRGLTIYPGDRPECRTTVQVKVIDDIAEVPDADVVLMGVKNYNLDAVASLVKDRLGDRPLVIGMQNGVENQQILPRYFSRTAYCVVSYNAWADEAGVIGYQKPGPLVLGTPDNSLQNELHELARVLNLGVDTVVTDHFNDAAHSKLVINLTNSLTTLIGHRRREISDPALFQKLLTNMTWEGVQIVRGAGYGECRLGGMPSWKTIWVGSHLPRAITKPIFERNVAKMVLSSMAQDILQRGGHESELETINGYLLSLADRQGLAVPYNRAIYDLCRSEFAKPHFTPLDVTDVHAAVLARG